MSTPVPLINVSLPAPPVSVTLPGPATSRSGALTVIATVWLSLAPRPSLVSTLTVSLTLPVKLSVARSAFTCARVPAILSCVVPEPITPRPVADSSPVVSLSTTVTVSPALTASASATLIPPIGAASPACALAAPGAVVTTGALMLTAMVLLLLAPRMSVVTTLIVSLPNVVSRKLSVASSAFTCARVPEMVSCVVPTPVVTPAPVADSSPVVSLSIAVSDSLAATAAASATLIPPIARATFCCTNCCSVGTVVTGGGGGVGGGSATALTKAMSVPVPPASAVTLKAVPLPIPVRLSVSLAAPLVTVSAPPAIVAVAPGAKVSELRSIVSPATKPEMAAPIVPAWWSTRTPVPSRNEIVSPADVAFTSSVAPTSI